MSATKLARQIVIRESPIGMTESLVKAMNERTAAILEGLKGELTPGILLRTNSAEYDQTLDEAIDYVIREINESGIDSINDAIEKSGKLFNINAADVRAVFESVIEDGSGGQVIEEEIDLNKFQNNFLSKLDNILEQNSGNILGFLDTTSAYVTPQEGKVLVEVYSNLNADNKKKLVEKLVSSKREFNKVLNFAVSLKEEK